MNELAVEDTFYPSLTHSQPEPSSTPADEIIDTLVGALESAISFLRKTALVRRAVTRVHRIQAGVALSDIAEQVADAFHVRTDLMLSKRRSQHIAYARQVAMYLSRTLTTNSFPTI